MFVAPVYVTSNGDWKVIPHSISTLYVPHNSIELQDFSNSSSDNDSDLEQFASEATTRTDIESAGAEDRSKDSS